MPSCMHGNTPEQDCGARACAIHGTPSASPYGVRRGAITEATIAADKASSAFFNADTYREDYRYA
jgi:hypothetical protein